MTKARHAQKAALASKAASTKLQSRKPKRPIDIVPNETIEHFARSISI